MTINSSKLDLVLVNPGAQQQIYQGLSTAALTAIEPPLWVGLLATYIRNHGFSVEIIDAEADALSPEEVGQKVAGIKALLAAVVVYGSQPSASTQKMTVAGEITSAIHRNETSCRTLLAGVHVSALPQRTIQEETVDFVAEGEGSLTILELLRVLQTGSDSAFEKVPGLWYRENGHIRSAPPAPISNDLDRDYPQMAWDLLPMNKYRAHNWHCFGRLQDRQPYAVLYTSLGCPFKCNFCCINAPFGKPGIRYRNPKNVIKEIDLLVTQYNVKTIKIVDELFFLNPHHVEEICDLIIERGYELNMWAYSRVDTVKEDLLPKLKKAGINWLALGIESGSKYVRDGVEKGRFGQDDILQVVRMIQDAGLSIIGNYIFGLPDDDFQSMQDTLDLALELNCEFANMYCAMAYPGSKLYTTAIEKKWKLPEKWHDFSQHGVNTLPLPTTRLTAGQVLNFRDRAFQIYFNHPPYLAMVEKKFGSETAEHIRTMSARKIERHFYDPLPEGVPHKPLIKESL